MVSLNKIVTTLVPVAGLANSSNFVGKNEVQKEVSGELFKAILLSFILIVLF